MTRSHNTPVFAKVWLSPSLIYYFNIVFFPTKKLRVNSDLELLAMFIWWNENLDFLFKFRRHSTLTYKWSSGYSSGVFPVTKRNKIQWKFKVAIRQYMSASMLTLRCAKLCSLVYCTCWWLFVRLFQHFWEAKAENQGWKCTVFQWSYTGRVVVVWLMLTCGFHWVGMATYSYGY